jgi:hypothetical protein
VQSDIHPKDRPQIDVLQQFPGVNFEGLLLGVKRGQPKRHVILSQAHLLLAQ